jgi:ABC-type metal ion transport system substrate-binding protein
MLNLKIKSWKNSYVQPNSRLQMKKLKVNIFIKYKLSCKLNTISIRDIAVYYPR